MAIEDQAVLTCPKCGQTTIATMPQTGCQAFFKCPHCQTVIAAKAGECCVFCSYADVKCPPKQVEQSQAENPDS